MIIYCPNCKQKYRVKTEYLGKEIICDKCEHSFIIEPSEDFLNKIDNIIEQKEESLKANIKETDDDEQVDYDSLINNMKKVRPKKNYKEFSIAFFIIVIIICIIVVTGDNVEEKNNKVTENPKLSEVSKKPEKPAYTLRKNIFRDIVKAEDRAYAVAQHKYPLQDPLKPGYSKARANAQLKKQAKTINKLEKKYLSKVAKQYNITIEQLNTIAVEGVEKNWRQPKL